MKCLPENLKKCQTDLTKNGFISILLNTLSNQQGIVFFFPSVIHMKSTFKLAIITSNYHTNNNN